MWIWREYPSRFPHPIFRGARHGILPKFSLV